ncbi:FHA domain-containing protein [uncultured Microbacterium sp.]|uniref:FHA domain-containing protein n=1 Tax=uncultured Microbacterium sp. TaxID=191216 RepID=UPI0025CE351C|nr:FHA domain-containing protein [uncultured Microbacterium sp.]
MTDAMTKTRIDYRPATTTDAWWLAADGDAVVLLSPAVSAATAAGVWRGLGAGGIGAVLEALTGAFGTSLTAIPPFALAIAEAGGARVAVRGDVEVVVEGDHPEAVSGRGVATWTERFVPGAVRVSVAPHPGTHAPAADVPLQSGVVRADLVEVVLAAASVASAPSVSPVPPAASAPAVAPAPAVVAPAPVVAPVVAVAPAEAPADAPSDAEESSDAEEEPAVGVTSASAVSSESVIDSVPPGLFGGAPVSQPAPDAEPQPAAPAADTSADTLIPEATEVQDAAAPPVDEYDLLWGETVARPVSAAAIVVADPEDADPEDAETASAEPASPEREPAPRDDLGDLGDHDGATIAVAEMRALRAERPAFDSTDNVPARRPARGRIRLSTGRVVELERPVIIGRRPKSTRTTGADLPTLVAVDSPDQDISRSHVEIRAEGEHVLVTDLDTTNGTVLLRGGSEPVRLHPNEPTMVVTGDVLDLGDDVTVTFEDLP